MIKITYSAGVALAFMLALGASYSHSARADSPPLTGDPVTDVGARPASAIVIAPAPATVPSPEVYTIADPVAGRVEGVTVPEIVHAVKAARAAPLHDDGTDSLTALWGAVKSVWHMPHSLTDVIAIALVIIGILIGLSVGASALANSEVVTNSRFGPAVHRLALNLTKAANTGKAVAHVLQEIQEAQQAAQDTPNNVVPLPDNDDPTGAKAIARDMLARQRGGAAILFLAFTLASTAAQAQTAPGLFTLGTVQASAPKVTAEPAPVPVNCKAIDMLQGFRMSSLTTINYSGPSGHVAPSIGGTAGAAYVFGLGLLPDGSCIPRLEFELAIFGTVGTSAAQASTSTGAAFKFTPAGIVGVRITGAWTAQAGAGFDMYNLGSAGASGFGASYSSIRNLSGYFGVACDFGPVPKQPAADPVSSLSHGREVDALRIEFTGAAPAARA